MKTDFASLVKNEYRIRRTIERIDAQKLRLEAALEAVEREMEKFTALTDSTPSDLWHPISDNGLLK